MSQKAVSGLFINFDRLFNSALLSFRDIKSALFSFLCVHLATDQKISANNTL